MSGYRGLSLFKQNGLMNTDAPDLGDLMHPSRDVQVTWCSSEQCKGRHESRRGKVVEIGRYLRKCPMCQSVQYLFFDSVSPKMAASLRKRMKTKE